MIQWINTTLPVAWREIRVAAHAPRTYRSRMFVAAGIVGMVWALAGFAQLSSRSSYLLGQGAFMVGAWWVFFMAAVGFGPTADAISGEKRAGTLGLLFLTHLKGRDVVLGKLVSNGLQSFAGLVALFPIMTIPVLLGGVEFSQCARLFLSVTNMLFFSAAAGLLASAVCLKPQVAQSKALQIVLLFAGCLPLAAFGLRHFSYDSALCLGLDLLSPVYAQRAAFGALVGPQKLWFWLSAGLVFAMSCGFLAAASWLAPRCWQEGKQVGLAEAIAAKFASAIGGTIRTRSRAGREALTENPYRWLAIRDQAIGRMTWIMIAAILSAVGILHWVLSLYWPPATFWLAVYPPFAFLLLTGLKARLSGSAVASIAEAKENGILELIMASSVRMRDVVSGQFRAAWQLFGLQLFVFVALLSAALIYCFPGIDRLAEMFTVPPEIEQFRFRAFLIVAGCVFFLFVDSFTLTWVGLCCAFRMRTPALARMWTGFWVIAFPSLAFGATVVFLLQFQTIRHYLEGFYPLAALWAFISLAIDLALAGYCRAWLFNAARQSVAAPPEHARDQNAWPSFATMREFLRTNFTLRLAAPQRFQSRDDGHPGM